MELRASLSTEVARSWLASGQPGHCGTTESNREVDCEEGYRGSFGLSARAALSWTAATQDCLERCSRCERCLHVSISIELADCSHCHSNPVTATTPAHLDDARLSLVVTGSWYVNCSVSHPLRDFRSAPRPPSLGQSRRAEAPCTMRGELERLRGQTIPPILHQSWHSSTLPRPHHCLVAKWRDALPPHWQHRLWNATDNRQLWAAHFPSMLPIYDSYKHIVQRADASRLLYMHVHGGVYADLDSAPCSGVAAALAAAPSGEPLQLLLVRDPRRGGHEEVSQSIVSNFFFASVRGHPFWRYAIQRLETASKDQRVSTTPHLSTTPHHAAPRARNKIWTCCTTTAWARRPSNSALALHRVWSTAPDRTF